MERYDISGARPFSLVGSIARIGLVAAAVLLTTGFLSAQEKSPSPGQPAQKKYSVKVDYPSNMASSYAMTEKTAVKRTYRDQQEKSYEREVSYYFTLGSIGEDEGGHTKVLCIVDSLRYTFKQDGKILMYDSQNPKASNIKGDFADLTYTYACLNHQFVLLLDKKNTVVNITGTGEPNDIDWLRNYIVVEGADVMDTAQKYLWLDGISRNRLQTLVDMNRGLVREKMLVSEDSTWIRPSIIRLDEIEFTDTLTAKVAGISRGVISIEAVSSGLKANTERDQRFFGIPGPAPVESTVSGKGKTKLKVNQLGSVRGYEADYDVVINGKYKNEKFVQSINTTVRCSILNQFRW